VYKYFRRGGFWFGLYFTISQGVDAVLSMIVTAVVRRSVKSVGIGLKVRRGTYFDRPKCISIGDRVQIGRQVFFGSEVETGFLRCGDDVQINDGAQIDYSGGLELEDRVTVSSDVVVYTHDHGLNPRSEPVMSPLIVCDGAWIGSGAIVLAKVGRIGRRSVIAAGSVVTKEVGDFTVVAGNPARVIRQIPKDEDTPRSVSGP